MKERAVAFGPGRTLVGVSCEPAKIRDGSPAVVLLNSGVMHHVGFERLYVRLARVLADTGIASLRFDFSGIGDSGPASSSESLQAIILADVAAAVQQVQKAWRIDRVVLLGLCSGARDAFDAAMRIDEVVGVVSIDLISEFQNWQHRVVHYARRFLRWKSWRNTISGENGTIVRLASALVRKRPVKLVQDEVWVETVGMRPVTSRDQLRGELQQFLARGGRVMFVFTGALDHNYNHGSQFYEALPEFSGDPKVCVEWFGRSDHIFSDRRYQSALIQRVRDWTLSQFGAE